MIIYNNKGNPYGLKIKICIHAAGSEIEYQEFDSDGMYECGCFQYIIKTG